MTYSVFDKAPSRRAIGDTGELLARAYFEKRGFRIIAQNIQYRCGEIDLILRRGFTLYFVEVKYRRSLVYGSPVESITWQKRKRLKMAVLRYLQEHRLQARDFQIDVLGILDLPHKEIEYTWISPAF